MIVNYTPQGWEIINQRAHGLLAMQLASHWQVSQRPERWMETLLAIAQHDDDQEDWQGRNHLNENGTPLHFATKKFSLIQIRRVTEMAQHKSRWIALLISKHMSFLYEPMRGENKELDVFLDQQIENQKQWSKALKVKSEAVQYAYDLLQWCDQFSLILAQNELPTGERALEISKGPDQQTYFVRQLSQGELTVDPWPFEEDAFTVHVESVCVTQLQFDNDEQLLKAMRQTPVETKVWQFTKH
jgi:hypothetical protein